MTYRFYIRRLIGLFSLFCMSTMISACAEIDYGDQYNTDLERIEIAKTLVASRDSGPDILAPKSYSCREIGGDYRPAGLLGSFHCIIQMSDSGRVCGDSSECSMGCVSYGQLNNSRNELGQCQPTNEVFGCYARVENGRVGPTICID
jgi:hypothetical protein